MYYAYVLRSAVTGGRYIGSCEDADVRLRRHNNGDTKSTRHGTPWSLVYKEQFETRLEALRRERLLKSGQGRQFLELQGL